ncbi:hypothetical protein ACFVAG_10665 [Streptomyces sp. NPDC057644]|uniref:hypothetical protein n=1 Tax=Streptomyces sp. NPDC057644 TaxID=3346191 RepID=UPI00368C30D7
MTAAEDVTESRLLLAEYDRIKDEQRARIGFRDNLVYVTLAASAGILAVAVQSTQPRILLAVPVICLILGWTYLINDEKISAIGSYIRERLGPRLGELAGVRGVVFGWEEHHRQDAGRLTRKRLQTAADLLTYVGLPVVCVAVFLCSPAAQPALVALSLAEAAGLMALGRQFLRYAER